MRLVYQIHFTTYFLTTTQSRARFRSHLIFRDLEQEMDEVDHQQEEQAETFARIFMARVQHHKRYENLANTQNINLFPPFSSEL